MSAKIPDSLAIERTPRMVIAALYRALTRQSWEEGPTDNEAIQIAHDWFYNTYGYETEFANEGMMKILTGELEEPTP